MEVIRNLVQSLVIIIILAMFLEMLLPAGQMRAYVKMVMGLLVIIAVIQAVGSMARWSFEEIPALVAGTEMAGVNCRRSWRRARGFPPASRSWELNSTGRVWPSRSQPWSN